MNLYSRARAHTHTMRRITAPTGECVRRCVRDARIHTFATSYTQRNRLRCYLRASARIEDDDDDTTGGSCTYCTLPTLACAWLDAVAFAGFIFSKGNICVLVIDRSLPSLPGPRLLLPTSRTLHLPNGVAFRVRRCRRSGVWNAVCVRSWSNDSRMCAFSVIAAGRATNRLTRRIDWMCELLTK